MIQTSMLAIQKLVMSATAAAQKGVVTNVMVLDLGGVLQGSAPEKDG